MLIEELSWKSVVSRRIILDEETSLCTDAASSFLPQRILDSRCYHAIRLLIKYGWSYTVRGVG